MQVSRQHVVDILSKAGFAKVAEEASRVLTDPVDVDEVQRFLEQFGITRDEFISQMGGSP
jgi:hypothetical protein